MTSDERIEKLLNRFGQTISDLPKPQTAMYAYTKSHIRKAYETATKWHGRFNTGRLDDGDYICHLVDVIDRMETALETALLTMYCLSCTAHCPDCGLDCETNAKICDGQLSGMYRYDFDKFVEDANDC